MQELALEELVLVIDGLDLHVELHFLPPLPPGNVGAQRGGEVGGVGVEGRRGVVQGGDGVFEGLEGRGVDGRVGVGVGVRGFGLGFGLDAVEVGLQAGGVVGRVERDDGRLDEPGGEQGPDFGDGDVVVPARVAEAVHPREAVVVGVVLVNGVVGSVGETEVDARHAGEVLEGGEVAAAAHGGDVAVPDVAHRLPFDGLVGRLHERGGFVQGLVEERAGGGLEVRAAGADVDVQVGDGALGEPGEILFDPLGRADEAVLLTVPAGEDERP